MKFEHTLQFMMDFYAELFPTRKHCLNHLFCTIGNGYEWENGELVDHDHDELLKRWTIKECIECLRLDGIEVDMGEESAMIMKL